MGLDMYARRVNVEHAKDLGVTEFPDIILKDQRADWDKLMNAGAIEHDFAYWRKHPDLHGWMENLYQQRRYGGPVAETDENWNEFNCIPIQLHAENLDALKQQVMANNLPHTTGFFFGSSQPEDRKTTLEFIARAKIAIAAGDRVYYDSWW